MARAAAAGSLALHLFLQRMASFLPRPAGNAAWRVGLLLITLSACSRATYVLSPAPRAYLATELPTPSVPAPAGLRLATLPASPLVVASPRPHAPARQRARLPRSLAASPPAAALVPLRAQLAAVRERPHPAAALASAGPLDGFLTALLLYGFLFVMLISVGIMLLVKLVLHLASRHSPRANPATLPAP